MLLLCNIILQNSYFFSEGFLTDDEWDDIVKDASPEFYGHHAEAPANSDHHVNLLDPLAEKPSQAIAGLLNMHVFGLANCLKRPIIVLDEIPLDGQKTRTEFGGIFLPLLVEPKDCAR